MSKGFHKQYEFMKNMFKQLRQIFLVSIGSVEFKTHYQSNLLRGYNPTQNLFIRRRKYVQHKSFPWLFIVCYIIRQEASVWRKYTWSVFRAMSHMLSIGYGRMPPHSTTDAWLTLLSMMIGGAFYAVFIGGISTISMAIDASGRMYNEKACLLNGIVKLT